MTREVITRSRLVAGGAVVTTVAVLGTVGVLRSFDDDAAAGASKSAPKSAPSVAVPVLTPSSGAPSGSPTRTPSAAASSPAAAPRGPDCVDGAVRAMRSEPVVAALERDPRTTTFAAALKTAGLAGTLDTTDGLTVFAPTNDAFAALPADQRRALFADPGSLALVLSGDVIAGRLGSQEIVGAHRSLAGNTVTVRGTAEALTANGAGVLCGNISTANAVVYLVDDLLRTS